MAAVASAVDRAFPVFEAGQLRDMALEDFRVSVRLAGLINPRTGVPFTEDELATATIEGSYKYIDASAIDQIEQVNQARALWLADQIRPERASTEWIQGFHDKLWGIGYLDASGGSGDVLGKGAPGVTFVGSTTPGAPGAVTGTDAAGNRYQVLFTATLDGSGEATLTLVGIDTGEKTNLTPGDGVVITWTNPPIGAEPTALVLTQFTGGLEAENDAQHVRRLERQIRDKQGASNGAQLRAWAEAGAKNAVESAFTYDCALYAGSGVLVPIQKRASNVAGPLGRIPSAAVLSALRDLLVPPGSPVVPGVAWLVVLPPVPVDTDMVIAITMPVGRSSGFADFQPWPNQDAGTAPEITAVTSQTVFQITAPTPLPTGITAPQMMVWDAATSRMVKLDVLSVVLNGGSVYDVTLSGPPAGTTIAVGQWVSPYSARALLLSTTIEGYFDGLGPGELLDVSTSSTDPRAARAFRFPKPSDEYPQRAGSGVLRDLEDALGATFVDGDLIAQSVAVPPLPTDPILGPRLLVPGRISISIL